jgi:hypothetical protein
MNVYTLVSLSITIAGFIGGVVTALVKLGTKTGRLMERLEQNEKRDAEEREKYGVNFNELYGRMNVVECDVKAQETNINNLMATCSRIENKLDRLVEIRG